MAEGIAMSKILFRCPSGHILHAQDKYGRDAGNAVEIVVHTGFVKIKFYCNQCPGGVEYVTVLKGNDKCPKE